MITTCTEPNRYNSSATSRTSAYFDNISKYLELRHDLDSIIKELEEKKSFLKDFVKSLNYITSGLLSDPYHKPDHFDETLQISKEYLSIAKELLRGINQSALTIEIFSFIIDDLTRAVSNLSEAIEDVEYYFVESSSDEEMKKLFSRI